MKPTEIVILGCGLSLDRSDPSEYAPSDSRIVIGINAAYALTPCDYGCSIDALSIKSWHRHLLGSNQALVTGKIRHDLTLHLPINALFIDDMIKYNYGGSGSIAFALAYVLSKSLPALKRIVYIGVDNSQGSLGGKKINYAHRLEPYLVEKQRALVSPAPNAAFGLVPFDSVPHKSAGMPTQTTISYTYGRQLRAMNRLFSLVDGRFIKLLECRSYTDIYELTRRKVPGAVDWNKALRRVEDRT
jgi:hypothetical protein